MIFIIRWQMHKYRKWNEDNHNDDHYGGTEQWSRKILKPPNNNKYHQNYQRDGLPHRAYDLHDFYKIPITMSNKAPSCNVPIITIQVSSRLGTTLITITTITFVIIIIIVAVTLTLTQCSNCCFQISARPATSPVRLPHLGPVHHPTNLNLRIPIIYFLLLLTTTLVFQYSH